MRYMLLLPVVVVVACAGGDPPDADVVPEGGSSVPAPPDASVEVATDASAADAGAAASAYRWVRAPIPVTDAALFDIWGSSPDDVWAVGARGTVLHWNGQVWQSSFTGVSDSLNAVWGTSASNVWIGSSTHLLLRGSGWNADGGSWTNTPPLTNQTNPSIATIYGIGGTGPNDMWAVGDWTIVYDQRLGAITIAAWHWSGDKWSSVPVVNDFSRPGGGTRVALRSVWPASSGDVWLGGNFGRTYRNPEWSPLVPIARSGSAFGMVALPPWKEYDSASRADIERTWGTWNDDVWAVGRNGVVRHWDGTSSFLWKEVDVGVTDDLHSVWGRASDDVWAIGDNSTIVHWDGKRWTREPTDPDLRLYGIWGDSKNVWIVGEGVILRRTSAKGDVQ